jgi:hypothetical protein
MGGLTDAMVYDVSNLSNIAAHVRKNNEDQLKAAT